jgi:NADP-dependent 3-hydroxy acid dehydrogenase YdfG
MTPGTVKMGYLKRFPQERIQSNVDVNVFGVMNVVRAVTPVFRKRMEWLILNVVPLAA